METTLRAYLFQFSDTGNHIDKTINEKRVPIVIVQIERAQIVVR
jgi:hypothetical protein